MGFDRFARALMLRLTALFACMVAIAWLLTATDQIAAPSLLTVLAAGLIWSLLAYVRRTNAELTRFLEAVRNADFTQRFGLTGLGSGFDELGESLDGLTRRFRSQRADQEQEVRRLRALVEHSPVPLMTLAGDHRTVLINNAARRLFDRPEIARLDDLSAFGPELVEALPAVRPGERRLVWLQRGESRERLAVAASDLAVGRQQIRLISLQNIQSELEGTELEAWQRLVRVLTHEIMNSITPITSLARTAVDLVDDAKTAAHPEAVLEDVREAVQTVARRADGLTQFVQSYRQLTRLPPPQRESLLAADLFESVARLVKADLAADGIVLEQQVSPPGLTLWADPDQLEQVLLNLVRNAAEALAQADHRRIRLDAAPDRSGRPRICVSDTGPGVDDALAEQIFIPFFTTKRSGSGVGLALSRQILRAHGGTIRPGRSEEGGARFTLEF